MSLVRPTSADSGPPDGLQSGQPVIGILEWFRPGEYDRVEQVLNDLKTLGVTYLRTGVSWADWYSPVGEAWYSWLLPRLAEEVDVLPCVLYTPPSLGIVPHTSAPPVHPRAFADFIDLLITRFDAYFAWIELWNEPNNLSDWNWRLDPEWHIFSEMIGGAAYWVQQRGKRTVLAGMCPTDLNWLNLMGQRGVLAYIDAVGMHGFPGTWEFTWDAWSIQIARLRAVLDQHCTLAQVWITETGFSTWKYDEQQQLRMFQQAIQSPVERVYWYALHDLHPDLPTLDGLHSDERHYHCGLKRADGRPKLLYRLWASGGMDAIQCVAAMNQPLYADLHHQQPVLITGGAGFIGTNLAHRLLLSGQSVILFDNLSHPRSVHNLHWLRSIHGDQVAITVADIRDRYTLRQAVQVAGQVYHLVTQHNSRVSHTHAIEALEVNGRGTLHLLEELRRCTHPPPLVFTSTSAVYTALTERELQSHPTRYVPEDDHLRICGLAEDWPLRFQNSDACAQGVADQYVLDYARHAGLPATVLRLSCIYGPHQDSGDEQAWVVRFLLHVLRDQPLFLHGNGCQVCDLLFIDDLVEALLLAQQHMPCCTGQAFNLGGGPTHTLSQLELLDMLRDLYGHHVIIEHRSSPDAPGLHHIHSYYVSNIDKFRATTGWTPTVDIQLGVQRLYHWLQHERTDHRSYQC